MGAGASVVTKEEVEKLPQYTILGGKLKLAAPWLFLSANYDCFFNMKLPILLNLIWKIFCFLRRRCEIRRNERWRRKGLNREGVEAKLFNSNIVLSVRHKLTHLIKCPLSLTTHTSSTEDRTVVTSRTLKTSNMFCSQNFLNSLLDTDQPWLNSLHPR